MFVVIPCREQRCPCGTWHWHSGDGGEGVRAWWRIGRRGKKGGVAVVVSVGTNKRRKSGDEK